MRALGSICLAGVLWGTVGVATLMMTPTAALGPELSALSRTSLGAIVLLAALPLLRVPRGEAPQPWLLLAVFGVAGAIFQITLFASFVAVGVTVTVIVTACVPVLLVAGWDTARSRKLPDPWLAVAVIAAGTGVVLASLGSEPVDIEMAGGGLVLVSASAAAFAVVALAGRSLGSRLHPARAAGLGLAATAATLAIYAVTRQSAADGTTLARLGNMPPRDLLLLGYVGLIATGGAYLAFVAGMGRARTASVGLAATLLEPGVAAALAALVLHEPMSRSAVGGCLLIAGGILTLALGESRLSPARWRRT